MTLSAEQKSTRINELRRQRSAIDAEIVRLGGTVAGNPVWECLRCGHRWNSDTPLPPKQCPAKGCRTPYWDRPPKQSRVDRAMGAEGQVPVVPQRVPEAPLQDNTVSTWVASSQGLPPDLPPPPPPVSLSSRLEALRRDVPTPSQPTEEQAIDDYGNGGGRDHAPAAAGTVVEQGDDGPDAAPDEHYADEIPDANDTADEADADGRTR